MSRQDVSAGLVSEATHIDHVGISVGLGPGRETPQFTF